MTDLHLSLGDICYLQRKLHEANGFREHDRLTTAERDAIFMKLALPMMPRLAFVPVTAVIEFLSSRVTEDEEV